MRRQRIEEKIGHVADHLTRLDAMLVVREPNTVYAAQAYEGLRKSIQFASQQQRIYISTLIGLLDDVTAGATLETLALRIQDRLSEAGAQVSNDTERFPEAFVKVEESLPTRPAWILVSNDQSVIVIRPGTQHPGSGQDSSESGNEHAAVLLASEQESLGETEPDMSTARQNSNQNRSETK